MTCKQYTTFPKDIVFAGLLGLVLVFAFPFVVRAATVYFSPSSGSYAVGQQFSVKVLVSSTDELMNAAGAQIAVSNGASQITSLSRSSSIVDFWPQEPSFTSRGVQLEGVVLDGYQGSAGELITLVFRARTVGRTNLSFTSGEVLAHDGLGTTIPSSFGTAAFTIIAAAPREEPPGAPRISSDTHPDENLWYSNADPVFTWELLPDVIDVDVLLSRDNVPPEYTDATEGKGLIDRFSLVDVAEGTHYIQVTFRTDAGWGVSSTFQFNVDTESPEQFVIEEMYRSSQRDDKRAKFIIAALDRTSGISHYRIVIDGDHVEDWVDAGSGRYLTPQLSYGKHSISVTAVDQAGNTRDASLVFSIPYPLELLLIFLIGNSLILLIALIILIVFVYRRYSLMKNGYQLLDKEEKMLLHHLQGDLTEIDKKVHQDLEEIKKRLKKK